jgi:hypothetical protein
MYFFSSVFGHKNHEFGLDLDSLEMWILIRIRIRIQ